MSLTRTSLKRALSIVILSAIAGLLFGCASREERIQALQAEANAALFANDFSTAIESLSSGLERYPDSNELRIALARAEQNAGNLDEAAALLEQAIAQDPKADQLWVKIGELRASLGQSQEAIVALEAYLKNHAGDFLAWKTVALESEKLGKLTDAIKAAGKWNEITPSAQPALKLGQLYLASRNLPQARSWFSQAAAYADQYASKEALAELIKLETSLKQFQQASIWLDDYTLRYGESPSDQRIQESQTVLRNWDRARREIAEAAADLERERDELEAQLVAEEETAKEGQPDGLANAVGSQISLNPEAETSDAAASPTPTLKEPLALFGDDERIPPANNPAVSEGNSAAIDTLEIDSYETAVAAHEAGNYADAIPVYWELLSNDSNDPQVWYRLSQAYFAQENWYDAESTILEAKRLAPLSEVIANQYLLTLAKTQSTVSVVEEIKALRLLFPRSPDIALTLARTLRNANAPRPTVAAAYRDVMTLVPQGGLGYQEANRYLQTGN